MLMWALDEVFIGYYGDPHLDIEGVPDPEHVPDGSTRPVRPGERPSVSGFTDQKSSVTSSVLLASRTGGRIADHDRR
jgi:hypothetical protein